MAYMRNVTTRRHMRALFEGMQHPLWNFKKKLKLCEVGLFEFSVNSNESHIPENYALNQVR